jgi:hypothetical protein
MSTSSGNKVFVISPKKEPFRVAAWELHDKKAASYCVLAPSRRPPALRLRAGLSNDRRASGIVALAKGSKNSSRIIEEIAGWDRGLSLIA